MDFVKDIDNLGAFSFIDDGYKRRFFNPQLRGAYHIDRVYDNSRANGTEYEYHNQKPNWHRKMVKMKKGLNLPVNILVGGEGFISNEMSDGGNPSGWGGLGVRLDYDF